MSTESSILSSTLKPTLTTANAEPLSIVTLNNTDDAIETSEPMFRGEKVDICMFGFIVVIICIVSGLFSCLVNVISKQQRGYRKRRYLFSEVEMEDKIRRKHGGQCYSATAAREDILY